LGRGTFSRLLGTVKENPAARPDRVASLFTLARLADGFGRESRPTFRLAFIDAAFRIHPVNGAGAVRAVPPLPGFPPGIQRFVSVLLAHSTTKRPQRITPAAANGHKFIILSPSGAPVLPDLGGPSTLTRLADGFGR